MGRSLDFAALAEHSPDVIARIDRAGRHLYVNGATQRVTGIAVEDYLGRTHRELGMPAPVAAAFDRHLGLAFATGALQTFEFEFPGAEGPRWFEVRLVPEWTGAPGTQDATVGPSASADDTVLAIGRDVTRQRETEAALRASEERLLQIAEAIPDVFWVADVDLQRVVYLSPAFERVWGVPCEDYLADASVATRLIHEEDREATLAAFARMSEEPLAHEYRIVRPDGAVRWLVSRAYPIRDEGGRVRRIAGVATDVTDRKLAERSLRDSEARFRGLIEQAVDAILVLAEDGRILDANEAAGRMLGCARDALLARNLHDFSARPTDAELSALLARAADGETFTAEGDARRLDGTVLPLEVRAGPVRFDGRTHVLGIARDVSERRDLEERLRQAQKLEAVGRLAGGIAHDFNNVLMVVLSAAELALPQLPPEHPVAADLRDIREASERAAGLTRQLLAFARQQVLQPRPFRLNDVVASAERLLRRVLDERVELVTSLADDVGVVRVDPVQIEQVLMNLVVNARDAMPDGGRAGVRTASVEVRAGAVPPLAAGRYALLEVSDTGVGMDEASRARVFDPFFSTKGTGNGLGLATVHGIVHQSGGVVTVESAPGRGSTFRVYLPEVPDHAAGGAAADDGQAAGPSAVAKGTVLLVEDEAAVRQLVRRILERAGYLVVEAADGETALRRLADPGLALDAVVSDVVMPGLQGPELAARVRALQPAWARLPVLLMSGYSLDAVRAEGHLVAGARFIAKPFAPETLLRTLGEMLAPAS